VRLYHAVADAESVGLPARKNVALKLEQVLERVLPGFGRAHGEMVAESGLGNARDAEWTPPEATAA
jgi:hypothetical protein